VPTIVLPSLSASSVRAAGTTRPQKLATSFLSAGIRRSTSQNASDSEIKFEVNCAIPLIPYAPKTVNQRVASIGSDLAVDKPLKLDTTFYGAEDVKQIISAAYRQIFGIHQSIDFARQEILESQLISGAITVKEFVKGLVLSEFFYRSNFETVSNYRFVELLVQRLLGREVYGPQEKVAWSIVIATKGVKGFVDALTETDEYNTVFGDWTLPYQRDRVLAGRSTGSVPFNIKTPRYDLYYRFSYDYGGYERLKIYNVPEPTNKTGDRTQAASVGQATAADFEVVSLRTRPSTVVAVAPKNYAVDLPLIDYAYKTQNYRVAPIGVASSVEAEPKLNIANRPDQADLDTVIYGAYRQIFGIHQGTTKAARQIGLESRLRNAEINIKEFIRGLVTSEAFLDANFQTNNNYRFVELAVQRILGRDVHGNKEKVAWSIVIATKGPVAFVEALLDSDEYTSAFGDVVVPYQRSRHLPNREVGETPFNLKTPRYGDNYRNIIGFPKYNKMGAMRKATPPKFAPLAGEPSVWLETAKKMDLPEVPNRGLIFFADDFLSKVPSRKLF